MGSATSPPWANGKADELKIRDLPVRIRPGGPDYDRETG